MHVMKNYFKKNAASGCMLLHVEQVFQQFKRSLGLHSKSAMISDKFTEFTANHNRISVLIFPVQRLLHVI